MIPVQQRKDDLRKEYLLKRDSLSYAEKILKNRQIQSCLFSIPCIQTARTIFIYVSFKSEVQTHDIICKSLSQGKIVAVPFIDSLHKKLVPSRIYTIEDLIPGTLGILEPKQDSLQPLSIDEIDVTITPGVVFSEEGWRLGYGGGYYDRFLYSTTHRSFALAYELQIAREIPHDDRYDVPVDYIVTENRIITCKQHTPH